MPLGSLAQHELDCQDVMVPCNFAGQGCGRRFKRKREHEHETEAAAEHTILALRELEECKKKLEEANEQLKEKDITNSSYKNVLQHLQQKVGSWKTEEILTITIPAVSQKVSDPTALTSYFVEPFPLPTRRGVYEMRLGAVFTFGKVSLRLHLSNADEASDRTPLSLLGSKISVVGRGHPEKVILHFFCDEAGANLPPGRSCEAGAIPSPQTGVSTLRDWLDGDALSLVLKLQIEMEPS